MQDRYTFTNWTTEEFIGRFGGQPYTFAPGETREFDPDKHYMLIVLSKQLADRELIRGAVNVGRDPLNKITFGHSLDINGQPYKVTVDMRREYMRKAIGALLDKPIPTPDQVDEEAGSTQEVQGDINSLKDQVRQLTELVQTLVTTVAEKPSASVPQAVPVTPVNQPVNDQVNDQNDNTKANISMTREILFEMAVEAGLGPHEGMTKEELVGLLNKPLDKVE